MVDFVSGCRFNSFDNFLSNFTSQVQKCKQYVKEHYVGYHDSGELREKVEKATHCPICKEAFNAFDRTMKIRKKVIHHHHLADDNITNDGPESFNYQVICAHCNVLIVKTSVVAISADLNRDGHLILSGAHNFVAEKFKVTTGEGTRIRYMSYDNCLIFDAKNFIDKPMHEIAPWLSTKNYPIMRHCMYKAAWKIVAKKFPLQSRHINPVIKSFLGGVLEIPSNFTDRTKFHFPTFGEEFPQRLYERTRAIFYETSWLVYLSEYDRAYTTFITSALADTFTLLDGIFYREFGISMYHSVSIHSYAMDVAMSYTNARFEFIKDEALLQMIKDGIKGPIEVSVNKYSEARSERLGDSVTNEERKEIVGLDLNQVYLGVLAEPLPVSDFKFVEDPQIDKLPEGIGRIYELDMGFTPDQSHDALPLCPYKRKISKEELSSEQHSMLSEQSGNPLLNYRTCLDFYDREKIVLHHKALDYYIERGMKVSTQGYSI